MNCAFEGDSSFKQKKRVDDILKEAQNMGGPGIQTSLDPILEENKNAVALYKPNMSLGEQRKLKNEELKKRVKMMTNADAVSTSSSK